jgi:hypothetical protein
MRMSYNVRLILGAVGLAAGLALSAAPAHAQRRSLPQVIGSQQAAYQAALRQAQAALNPQPDQQQPEAQRRQQEEAERFHDELAQREFKRRQQEEADRFHDEMEHREFHRQQEQEAQRYLAPSYPQGVPPWAQGRW